MKYKLKELIKLKTQGVNTTTDNVKYVDKGYKIIQAKNIEQYKVTFDEKNFIDVETFNRMKENHILHNGDVLFTNIGSQLGNCAIYDLHEKAIITWNVMKLVPDETKILKEYLCYLLNHNSRKIKKLNSSSTMPFVSGRELMEYELEVPNIEIQKKVVKILKEMNRKIKLNNQINSNLQELLNTVFTNWFCEYDYPDENNQPYKSSDGKMIESELGEIPESWRIGIFQDIIDFSNGYGFKSNDLLDSEEKETYKVFKQGNINLSGGINEEKTKSWFYKEKAKGLEKFILKKGDILMCMTDMKNSTSPLLGHTALMNVDDEYIVNQRVGLIRCKKEITDYPYVYTMSNLEYFLKDIRSRANSGVQVNLSTQGICETKIIIPDKRVLDKYNEFAIPLYEMMFKNQKENQDLEQLRDTLLLKLMNGEINLEKVKI